MLRRDVIANRRAVYCQGNWASGSVANAVMAVEIPDYALHEILDPLHL